MKRVIIVLIGAMVLLICGFLTVVGGLLSTISDDDLGGEFVFGENATLRSNDEIGEDLVVMGGNFTMEESSKVHGDLAIFGGNVESDGLIDGDVAVFGGNLNLGSKAEVSGDVAVIGGNANVSEQASVHGQVHTAGGNATRYSEANNDDNSADREESKRDWSDKDSHDYYRGHNWHNREFSRPAERGFFGSVFSYIGNVIGAIFITIVLLGIALLIATFVPEQMKQVGDSAAEHWLLSFGVGSATLFVSALLVVAICLIFPAFIWFAVAVATLFGWIAIGQLIGERVLIALERPYSSFVTSTLTGVAVLSLIMHVPDLLGPIWCIGGLLSLAAFLVTVGVMATGLGAVILTRFGTQPYETTVSLTK